MLKKTILTSPRLQELKKKKRKISLIKFVILVLSFFVIVAGSSYISRIPAINIREVEIESNKVADMEVMQKIVEEEIAGNYLWLFPKANIFLYPRNKIQEKLHGEFQRIKDVDVSVKDRQKIIISVSEREAVYIWCGEKMSSEDKCYFLDKDGFVFDKAPYFSGDVYFKFYGKISSRDDSSVDIDNPSGNYFLEGHFGELILFKDVLQDMGLKPIALYKESDEDITILLSKGNSSSANPEIIFKIGSDFQKLAENLQAALSTEPLKSEFKNKYASLQYIDLRFGNKVYYKFR